MIFILRDSSSDNIEGVILSKETEKYEIESIIEEVKENRGRDDYEDYDDFEKFIQEIEESLPDDCELYLSWTNDIDVVWL